jgi:hypothetical protein
VVPPPARHHPGPPGPAHATIRCDDPAYPGRRLRVRGQCDLPPTRAGGRGQAPRPPVLRFQARSPVRRWNQRKPGARVTGRRVGGCCPSGPPFVEGKFDRSYYPGTKESGTAWQSVQRGRVANPSHMIPFRAGVITFVLTCTKVQVCLNKFTRRVYTVYMPS